MTGALGLGPLTLDFSLGVGVGLLLALSFYVLKQIVPWEYQRYRETKRVQEDLTEELWFYLNRVIRQWERRQKLFTTDPADDTEAVLAQQAHADLAAALEELTKFLEGGAGTIDRERVQKIDEASRELRDICLALGESPSEEHRRNLEVDGDEVCERLSNIRNGL